MNKKIKVIDLLEMFYKKEKMPQRIKVSCYEFEYNEEINAYFNLDKNSNSNSLIQDWLNNASKLNNEVEILEDNTEEIEELDTDIHIDSFMDAELSFNKIAQEINKLGKAIRELRKEKE